MALGEKLTPEAKAELLDRLRAKYADDDSPVGERWHDLGALEDTDDTPPGARGLDTLRRFFELLEAERPAWQADALCLEYPDVAFFPEPGESTEPAKAICARCLVAEECGAWAVTIAARDGIWAGESARTLQRSRAAA
jgi:WhiB family transcriptional regulator, redox-sensing transcriptional regulator